MLALLAALFTISVVHGAPIDLLKENEHKLTWDTYWVKSGKIETQTALVSLPLDLVNQPNDIIHSTRNKRLIYGEDDRERINPATDGRRFPYSTIMRVSTGCSGIMVTPNHVLTAAHCVHDGQAYRGAALFLLRAGYIQEDGDTKWSFVRRFFIPSQWKDLTSSNEHVNSDWDDYDVAILEMESDMSQERDHIPPGLSGLFCDTKKSLNGGGTNVEYVSFPDDKSREALWLVQTKISSESPHLIYFLGDAWHGSSGAGLYTWDYNDDSGKYERRVVGVLSGNRNTESFATVQGNFNVAARLNPVNFMLICHWIGTVDECKKRYMEYLDDSKRNGLCSSV